MAYLILFLRRILVLLLKIMHDILFLRRMQSTSLLLRRMHGTPTRFYCHEECMVY